MNVKTLCLGVLSLGEASGYEIKKEIEEGLFSHFIDASFGSIYPALMQLNAEGSAAIAQAAELGRQVAEQLLSQGAAEIIAASRDGTP